ncbi:G-protein-signaling modulator 2-like [Hydra vulgaris]|uniref:G-protein-signaling modulator 2-like n=1 Tax=Hydra vulgaris TaxID=6087 RepID=A0ABM4BAE9_HYDVU
MVVPSTSHKSRVSAVIPAYCCYMASNGAICRTIDISNASCMELALQGEQYCKNGDCRDGVEYFETANKVGTEDLKTLSAVYSQLGNTYFYLKEYEKALEYPKHDLTLARTLGDGVGEAKAREI